MPYTTKQALEALIASAVGENRTVELKRQPPSTPAPRSRLDTEEVAKDISSFANSAGGVIVYGLKEREVPYPPEFSRFDIGRFNRVA